MRGAATARGIKVDVNEQYTRWLRAAGFVNIREEKLKWPIGPWAKDRFWKRFGTINLDNMMQGLEGMSIALLTKVKNWSEEEVKNYLEEVRKDMKSAKTQYYMPV